MASFVVCFSSPSPSGGRFPGWCTIEEARSAEDAASCFFEARGSGDIPAEAELETIRRA